MTDLRYPAARQALASGYGDAAYAQYLDDSMAEHVAKGHYSEEHAQGLTLGELFIGNDGE